MLRRLFTALLVCLAVSLPLAAAEPSTDAVDTSPVDTSRSEGRLTQEQVAHDVLTSMDPQVDPCQDFYQYACGGWLASEELPGDQTRWARSFSVIQERNREIVRNILEGAAATVQATPAEAAATATAEDMEQQRIGKFYASCMDETAIEAQGSKPLAGLLAEIKTVEDAASLLRVTGLLHRHEVGAVFAGAAFPDFKDPAKNIAFFFQGGLGMPDRDYYVSDDATKKELLVAYEAYVAQMLQLLGDAAPEAQAKARRIVAFETRLAESSRPRDEMRVMEKLYNKLDKDGLQELTPDLPWDAYFKAIGHPEMTEISVATPEFFTAFATLVGNTEPAVLQDYLRWHLVNDTADLLSKDFVDARFDFYGRRVQGQREMQPRWKRCVDASQEALGEAIGQLYVAETFAGNSKQVALEMIDDIETAFEGNLPHLSWMDDTTRQRALEKAQAVSNKIGYPDVWRDYSKMQLKRGDFFHNAMSARAFEFDRSAHKVGQPVDPNEWGMTPQMVNAYYNPLQNEIAFPAGILQPPFFHRDFPAAMNYGAVGAVMGHELSHGFDDQGRKFAPDGQLRLWWEESASQRFEEQAACVENLYSTYEIEPGVAVNGKLTLGENIADIGGVKQAFNAYKNWKSRHEATTAAVPGLSDEQLFFVSFGQVWCSLTTPEQARLRVTTDSHSPARFRVLGPITNNAEFAEAFQCAEGTPMHPKTTCEVW